MEDFLSAYWETSKSLIFMKSETIESIINKFRVLGARVIEVQLQWNNKSNPDDSIIPLYIVEHKQSVYIIADKNSEYKFESNGNHNSLFGKLTNYGFYKSKRVKEIILKDIPFSNADISNGLSAITVENLDIGTNTLSASNLHGLFRFTKIVDNLTNNSLKITRATTMTEMFNEFRGEKLKLCINISSKYVKYMMSAFSKMMVDSLEVKLDKSVRDVETNNLFYMTRVNRLDISGIKFPKIDNDNGIILLGILAGMRFDTIRRLDGDGEVELVVNNTQAYLFNALIENWKNRDTIGSEPSIKLIQKNVNNLNNKGDMWE